MDTDQLLVEQFVLDHPKEAAQVIEKLKDAEIASILEGLHEEQTIVLLNKMSNYKAAKSLMYLNEEMVLVLFEKLEVRTAELILRQCNPTFSNLVLDGISSKLATVLRNKLKYKADTVGSFMNPSTFAFRNKQTLNEAIKILKQEKVGFTSIVGVIDENENLEGLVLLQDLLFVDSESEIASIMQTNCPRFKSEASIQSIANHPAWIEFKSIPVVGDDGKLVGILNFADINKINISPEKAMTRQILETSNSLGELFRIGISGFLQVVDS